MNNPASEQNEKNQIDHEQPSAEIADAGQQRIVQRSICPFSHESHEQPSVLEVVANDEGRSTNARVCLSVFPFQPTEDPDIQPQSHYGHDPKDDQQRNK